MLALINPAALPLCESNAFFLRCRFRSIKLHVSLASAMTLHYKSAVKLSYNMALSLRKHAR
jgi:hypothetical protein